MVLKSLSEDISRILRNSSDHARRYQQDHIDTEHMLLAVLDNRDSSGARLLKKLGVDENQLRRELESRTQRGSNMFAMGKVPQSDDVRKVIDEAERVSDGRKGTIVRSIDLVLALLRCAGGPASAALQACGLNYADAARKACELADHVIKEKDERIEYQPTRLSAPAPLTSPISSTPSLLTEAPNHDIEVVPPPVPGYERNEFEDPEETAETVEAVEDEEEILPAEAVGDEALLEIMDAWPNLHPALRQGILAMIRNT